MDQATAIAAIEQRLATARAQLASGVTRMDENGRSIAFSLPVIQQNIARDEAELARLKNYRPMVRRILTYTSTKGY